MPKVLARHLIQSFDIGEVTPEEAHEVGKQLADEWLKGKYEYVIATHIDKGHCHRKTHQSAAPQHSYHNILLYVIISGLSDGVLTFSC